MLYQTAFFLGTILLVRSIIADCDFTPSEEAEDEKRFVGSVVAGAGFGVGTELTSKMTRGGASTEDGLQGVSFQLQFLAFFSTLRMSLVWVGNLLPGPMPRWRLDSRVLVESRRLKGRGKNCLETEKCFSNHARKKLPLSPYC